MQDPVNQCMHTYAVEIMWLCQISQFKIPGLSSDENKSKASTAKNVTAVIAVSFVYIILQYVTTWTKVAWVFKP